MKVKVPPVGILVHYRGHPGDRFGDRHNAGEPIMAVIIGLGDPSNPSATVRCFPDSDSVPLRRDAAIVLSPGENSSHCVSPLPGTLDSWMELELQEPGPVFTAEPPAAAIPAPAPSGVVQRPVARPPETEPSSSVDAVLGKLK